MKKTGILVLLLVAAACAQNSAGASSGSAADANAPQGTIATSNSFPIERVQTPTYADLYCAGFINKQILPNANYVAGGLQTPNTTKFVTGDIIYLAGTGYSIGAQYTILRELKDQNRYEVFPRKLVSPTVKLGESASSIPEARWLSLPLISAATPSTPGILPYPLLRSLRSRSIRRPVSIASLLRAGSWRAGSCWRETSTPSSELE